MKRRSGITLVEVLIAIFIMAIGLLALLTLFPLGALRMSQALTNDRAASCASAGANICDAFNIRNDPIFDFINPAPPNANGYPPTAQAGGGFPVFVDPYGVANGSPPLGLANIVTAPNPPTPGIQRMAPSVIPPPYSNPNPNPALPNIPVPGLIASRYFTLLDDMTFLTNGLPDTSSGVIQRGDRYTWGLLLHRLQPYSTSSLPDVNVVVYAGRATALPGGEATYAAAGNYQDTQVILTHNGTAPTIRRGSWILDTSYEPATSSVHGDFYRVISVTTLPGNQVSLELQNPISKPTITAVTVMDNVVEVFERGTYPSNQWEFRTENP